MSIAKRIFLSAALGGAGAALLITAASAFSDDRVMAAILGDPAQWLSWPIALGATIGAAWAALRQH